MQLKLTSADREKLQAVRDFGQKVELVAEVLKILTNRAIEQCKNEFSTLPVINYQNIDNSRLFMLQFEMKAARDLQTAIEIAILNGKDAEETLTKKQHGGE